MEALGTHHLDRGIATVRAAVSDLDGTSLLGLDAAATGDALVALGRLRAQVSELELRVLAHAAQVHVEEVDGSTSTAAWLAQHTHTTVRTARRATHLANALERYRLLAAGMASGAVNLEQAEVIARSLDALPLDLAAWIRTEAERTLVDLAATHDARSLRVLGERILHLVAPEVGVAHEAALLDAAERTAEKATCLTLSPDGTGKVHGRFTLPDLHAGMLRKLLTALVVHEQPPADAALDGSPVPRRPSHQQLGQAFCEHLERLDGRDVPDLSTGAGPTLVVTMTLETLRGGLAAATLDTGDRLSAHTARRLACEAGIVPVVLGGRSKVLDVGRRRRLFTKAQRLALVVRDQHCTATGCQTPAWFCHAHHDDPWSHGGPTNLTNGRLLCPSHHRRAHDPRYDAWVTPDDQVRFTLRR
jgi:hypothetical protein